MNIRWEFKPQDLWVGVFWKTTETHTQFTGQNMLPDIIPSKTDICLIPMFPIHINFSRQIRLKDDFYKGAPKWKFVSR